MPYLRFLDFADAPIARGVSSAQDGTLSIMVGGSESVFNHIKPVMECMGTEITHCGAVGTGQVMKLMNKEYKKVFYTFIILSLMWYCSLIYSLLNYFIDRSSQKVGLNILLGNCEHILWMFILSLKVI